MDQIAWKEECLINMGETSFIEMCVDSKKVPIQTL